MYDSKPHDKLKYQLLEARKAAGVLEKLARFPTAGSAGHTVWPQRDDVAAAATGGGGHGGCCLRLEHSDCVAVAEAQAGLRQLELAADAGMHCAVVNQAGHEFGFGLWQDCHSAKLVH